nr:MAG TPA_asm: hypothetical protein [Caudoviricetes sp.]
MKSNNLKVISHKNSVRTEKECHSNAISISTYQCLSYHNLKALHIGELQAAIFVTSFSFFGNGSIVLLD